MNLLKSIGLGLIGFVSFCILFLWIWSVFTARLSDVYSKEEKSIAGCLIFIFAFILFIAITLLSYSLTTN